MNETLIFLQDLNPAQSKAVAHLEGPMLVLAGAGSGKTRVITARIANLILNHRVSPYRIFAVTFTNKAAREMKERVEKTLGDKFGLRGMTISTFHSASAQMLRRYGEVLGYSRDFIIFDEKDQDKIITATAKEINLSLEVFPKEKLKSYIDHYKGAAILPGEDDRAPETLGGEADPLFVAFYKAYQRKLKEADAMDFGDLILNFRRLLVEGHPAGDEIRRRFQFLLVDEFQDTNTAQYLLLKALLKEHKNIFAVGDDDQSIYRWRGAQVGNILRFPQEFDPCPVLRLEENYRSAANILKAASVVIANNQKRHAKTLVTSKEAGEKLSVNLFATPDEECGFVASEIKRLSAAGKKLGNIAVFYRVTSISRVIEDALVRNRIPYKVVGGLRFYERKEVKDFLSYLRLILNPHSDLDFERASSNPPRGIGDKTFEALSRAAKENRCSIYSFVRGQEAKALGLRGIDKAAEFASRLDDWRRKFTLINPIDVIKSLPKESGFLAYIEKKEPMESERLFENVQELITALDDFYRRFSPEDKDETGFLWLREFLESVSLDAGDSGSKASDVVSLMTVHASKGLEFDTVFVTALEEKIFPHSRSLDSNADLEEERRLFYVALTRAKRKLYLSSCCERNYFGSFNSQLRSRFIDELPPDVCEFSADEHLELQMNIKRSSEKYRPPPPRRERGRTENRPIGDQRSYKPAWELEQKTESDGRKAFLIKKGSKARGETATPNLEQWVEHPKFGRGIVKSKEGGGNNPLLLIYFPSLGASKSIVASYVKPIKTPQK